MSDSEDVNLTVHCKCDKNREGSVYCEEHDEIICEKCKATDHWKCKTENLDKKSLKYKSAELDATVSKVRGLTEKLEDVYLGGSSRLSELADMKNVCKENIKAIRQEFNDFLDKLEEKTIEELDYHETLQRQILEDNLSTLSTMLEELISNSETLKTAKEGGRKEIRLALDIQISKLLPHYRSASDDIAKKIKTMTLKVYKSEILESMLRSLTTLGRVFTSEENISDPTGDSVSDLEISFSENINMKGKDFPSEQYLPIAEPQSREERKEQIRRLKDKLQHALSLQAIEEQTQLEELQHERVKQKRLSQEQVRNKTIQKEKDRLEFLRKQQQESQNERLRKEELRQEQLQKEKEHQEQVRQRTEEERRSRHGQIHEMLRQYSQQDENRKELVRQKQIRTEVSRQEQMKEQERLAHIRQSQQAEIREKQARQKDQRQKQAEQEILKQKERQEKQQLSRQVYLKQSKEEQMRNEKVRQEQLQEERLRQDKIRQEKVEQQKKEENIRQAREEMIRQERAQKEKIRKEQLLQEKKTGRENTRTSAANSRTTNKTDKRGSNQTRGITKTAVSTNQTP